MSLQLTGEMLIGGSAIRGTGASIRTVNPATDQQLDPLFSGSTTADVTHACALAWDAFDSFREAGPDQRARLLEAMAEQLLELGDVLI
jgi:2,5-dioxopentanoate dehydrogenase